VLVEGNMDVVASHQAGVRQAVAASGTALTLEQLRALSKLTRNIKLAFDSDAAGLTATERAIELGQQLGLTVRMITMGEAKDPDELIKRDPKAWQQAISDAKYAVDYLLDRFEQEYDLTTALGKRQYTDRVVGNLRRLADPVERDHYVALLAKRLDVAEDAIRQKIDQPASGSKSAPEPVRAKVPAQPKAHNGRVELEESLLSLCLAYQPTRASLGDLQPADFSSQDRQEIFNALRQQSDVPGEAIAMSLTDLTDSVNILLLRGEELFESLAPADRSMEAFQLARRLRIASNKEQRSVLTQRIREAEKSGDAALRSVLLQEYQAILAEEEV